MNPTVDPPLNPALPGGREPRSFIHYLPRHVALSFPNDAAHPWYRRFQSPGEGFDRPGRHTTRQRSGAASTVLPGDTLWLVSQVHSRWGSLPPGIDSRLDVEAVRPRRGGGFHYVAAPTSRWFALADATDLLQALGGPGGRPLWANPDRPIGHSLQSLRRLHDAESLSDWERKLDALPLEFISYRIADGSEAAFRHALHRLKQGGKVFWDRWGLPRRLAERREVVASSKLHGHLMEQLGLAATVWGIETDGYQHPGSYAQKECAEARRLGTYRAVKPV